MNGDDGDPDLFEIAKLVEELGLSALGYRAAFERESSGRVTVCLQHPLRGRRGVFRPQPIAVESIAFPANRE